MTHIAVAARSAERRKRFSQLLDGDNRELDYASDVETLARRVKSKPIDVIVFDLQAPAMDVGQWLAKVDADKELAWVPVIWIGADVSESVRNRVSSFRPGICVTARPDANILTEAINSLIGSQKSVKKSTSSGSDSSFNPGEGIIDQALGIFSDPSEERAARQQAAEDEAILAALGDESDMPSEPPRPQDKIAASSRSTPKESFEISELSQALTELPADDGDDDEPTETGKIDFGEHHHESPDKSGSVKQAQVSTVDAIEDLFIEETEAPQHIGLGEASPSQDQSETNANESPPPLSRRLAEEIADALAKKLAREIAAQIDRDLIRRVIEEQFGGR